MTETVLQLTDLTRRFGSLTAVDGVSLSLPRGARHAVIGPNGAGKSTLLNLIAGTDRPDGGSIALDGSDVSRLGPARRSGLGIARSFQQPTSVAELTALDNVVLASWRHHRHGRALWRRPSRHRRLAEEALGRLDTVGLAGAAHRTAGSLSHGQRRMLDLAAALSGAPRLLLLDEPAAGLTDSDIVRLLDVLDHLDDQVAVILVEHHSEVVARFADTVTVLAAGRELVTGPTRQALAHPEVREAYLAAAHGGAEADGEGADHGEGAPDRTPPPHRKEAP